MKLSEATPDQREAITTTDPNVLIVAGPGSGKTATTVARIGHLIGNGVDAKGIVCLTFTNAAANELSKRLKCQNDTDGDGDCDRCHKIGGCPNKVGFIGTLHSFALRMLKEYGEAFGYGARVALISSESAADLIESKARSLACYLSIAELLKLKREGLPPRGSRLTIPQTVIASYFAELKESGVVDYDVLLTEFRDMLADPCVRENMRSSFAHLFVDEVQDSGPVDWGIYHGLPIANKFFVGDPDQAVYGFRGGSVNLMLAHSKLEEVKTIKLEENFRCSPSICAAANNLIRHNVLRVEKETRTAQGSHVFPGSVQIMPIFANEGEEIAVVAREINDITEMAYDDVEKPMGEISIAVLARTNHIAEAFRKTLAATGIPTVERTTSALPSDWPMARSFLELLCDPENDTLAFFHIVALQELKGESPKGAREIAHAMRRTAAREGRSINEAVPEPIKKVSDPVEALKALAKRGVSREAHAVAVDAFKELPVGATMQDFSVAVAEIRERVKESGSEDVNVLTIHGAKGREFDAVFLVGAEDQIIPGRAGRPCNVESDPSLLEEERRLFYVAITRARSMLYVSSAVSRVTPWKLIVSHVPSRFVAEMGVAS